MNRSENPRDAIAREARRIEEDCLYSAKAHFIAARTWTNVHLIIGIPSAVLAGGAGVSGFNNQGQLAGVLGILAAALASVWTFLNPNESASTHQVAGARYNELRNRARLFREISVLADTADEELQTELKSLARRRDKLNESGPQIPAYAYRRAKRSISKGEADYAADQIPPTSSSNSASDPAWRPRV